MTLGCAQTTSPAGKRFAYLAIAAIAAITAIGLVMLPALTRPTRGANITWTGLGATTNWNLGANWSTGVPPGAADIAVFDGTSSKVALVNANINVGGVYVTTGYAGSITQGAGRTITVGASGWSQDAAGFAGSAAAITVNGPFSLTGGTFTSTTGILSVAGAFTQGAGTYAHSAGTLRLIGAAAAVDVPGTLTVWNFALAQNNATPKTLDPADLLVVDGTLTLTNGTWEGGELRSRGPIAATSTFDGGDGTLRIDGSADQLFTGSATVSAGELPNLVIDKASGTLSLAGTIRVATGGWTYLAGALDPGSSTVSFDSGSLIAGSHALANVVLRGSGAKTLPAGDTLTVGGLLTLTDGTWDGGTLLAAGDLTQAATFDGGSGTLRIGGAGAQLFTGSATVSAGELPNLVIDKTSGTLSLAGTIRVATGGWTYLAGALDPGSSTVSFDSGSLIAGSHALANVVLRGSGAKTLPAGDTLTVGGLLTLTDGTWDGGTLLAAGDLTQAATFDGGSGTLRIGGAGAQLFTGSASSTTGQLPAVVIDKPGGTLSLAGTIRTLHDWTYLAGALDADGSTLVFGGALTISGSHSLGGVEFRGANAKTIEIGTTLVVDELLRLTDGTLTGDTVAARGPIAATSTFDGGDGTLRIDGSADQLFTGSATVSAGELPNLVIDKTSGTLSLAGTIRVATGGWTYLAGALDPGSSTVSFDSGSLIAGSHALANVVLRGSGAKTLPAGDTLTVGGLLTLTDGTWDGGTLLAAGDLTQAATFDGGSGTLRIGGAGAQLFTGSASSTTGQLPAVVIDKPGGTLSLAGTIRTLHDWTYLAGALDADGSTLVLSGTQTLSTQGATLNRLQVRGATATLSGGLVLASDLVTTSGSLDLDANAVDVAGSVTVAGTLLAAGADLHIAGNFLVTGTLVADGSAITLDGSGLQHLDAGGAALGDLVMDGAVGAILDDDVEVSGTLDLAAGTLMLDTRRLTIEHPIAGTPTNLVAGATSSLTIAGATAGIHVPASVTDLAELSIQTLEVVTLDTSLALHVGLFLDGGNLDANGHLVRILAGATVARTSGHVIGTLEKAVPSGGPLTVTFEIGDASGYTPIIATWAAVSLDGTLAASTAAGDDAAGLSTVGLVPGASVNRTWTLSPTGLASDPVEVGVTYLPSDLDPQADPASLLSVISAGGSSTLPDVIQHSATGLTVSLATGATGTLALGMPGSDLGVTIDGTTDVVTDTPYPALVTVTNLGAFSGTASVEIDLDPGTALVSATPSQGSCTHTVTSVSCALGPMAPGASATIDLVLRFSSAGPHRLAARVVAAATSVDPEGANDLATLDLVASGLLPEPQPEPTPGPSPTPSATPGPGGELPDTARPASPIGGLVELSMLVLGALTLVVAARLGPSRTLSAYRPPRGGAKG